VAGSEFLQVRLAHLGIVWSKANGFSKNAEAIGGLVKSGVQIIFVFLFLSCEAPLQRSQLNPSQASKNSTNQVIYGEDGRQDYSSILDPELQKIARSTVAIIGSEKMVYDSIFDRFHFENPDQEISLCSSEKFRNQPKWAWCSGALIAPDLILTAGHCVKSERLCHRFKFVFDYTLQSRATDLSSISASHVYDCREVLAFSHTPSGADYAIVRLDREVSDREPLTMAEEDPGFSDDLMIIGHPQGLPTKLTMNGKVRSLVPEIFFKASLDAFQGNSGSSVFNQKTRQIVGVLVRGEQDYERQNGCYVAKVCGENDCRGEDVMRISEIRKKLPEDFFRR
jgi:hypothetical protein